MAYAFLRFYLFQKWK